MYKPELLLEPIFAFALVLVLAYVFFFLWSSKTSAIDIIQMFLPFIN